MRLCDIFLNSPINEKVLSNNKLGRTDLVRDKSQHITVTVCFYYAVPDGILTDENVSRIRDDLTSVYKDGFWTGSLVTGQQVPVEELEPPIKLTQEMKDFIHLNYPKYEYNPNVKTFPSF